MRPNMPTLGPPPKKSPLPGVILVALMVGGLAGGIYWFRKRTDLPAAEVATPAAQVSPDAGPAAVVEAIPTAAELVADLEAAGFAELYFSKLGDGPCFAADGVDCRETRICAIKPAPGQSGRTQEVLYKGPAKSITDDAGNRFDRGVWTVVSEESARRLRSGPLADHFAL